MSLSAALLIILVIFFVVAVIYYYYTPTLVVQKEPDFKVALMSNYNRDKKFPEVRVMHVIEFNDQYYVYSNKNASHIQQLRHDNRVNITIYKKQDKNHSQLTLYGHLEEIKESENLILHKLIVDHQKTSRTTEDSKLRVTTYDGNSPELITDFKETIELIGSIVR